MGQVPSSLFRACSIPTGLTWCNFRRGGAEALRAYGRREGFLLLNGLNYGENWLGGDWVGEPKHFLYSYDRFFDYCLRLLDRFSGKGEAFYQFWNEPDFFWRPGLI